ncbi:MAG TPA: ATP-binding protein [Candidatus Hydrogenedentes bacterium]|nr:ATP-binding protein [Candidatus Hydrogenedentota bacterium]HPG69274.1 ATP-binding protein [Candidatus Hydrogenedentota bacterium]
MYVRRTIEGFFREAQNQFPVLLITGPRQVGKTTCLQHLCTKRQRYVTLDDPMARRAAREDPALFLQRFPPPLVIDEIQYAPELLPYIKMAVDSDHAPGMFWLTGSQQFHVMKGVSESLAGRVGVLNLLGFSRAELVGARGDPFLPDPKAIDRRLANVPPLGLKEAYASMWRGSFPANVLNDDIKTDFFYRSYVETYLQRDVRDLARVGDEMAFLRFLRAAAARTAQVLNLSDLARDADIAPNTAKHWLSILQTSGIAYLLEPFHTNVTKRLVKAPKLYLLDTGLVSYLTEWTSPETLEAGAMSGAIFETWVVAEILKSYWHNGKRAPLYYYRDKDKKEIDLLIFQDGTLYPIECKKTAMPGRDDVRHFAALEKLAPDLGPGGIICLATQALPLTPSCQSIPLAAL